MVEVPDKFYSTAADHFMQARHYMTKVLMFDLQMH